MFSALRQGNALYVLTKSPEPKLRVAQVCSVSAPQPKFGQQFTITPETTVNVNVKFDDDTTMEFKQLPSQLAIASFDKDGTIVAESREQMSQEVETMLRSSRSIIDSIPYHEKVVSICEDMMRTLNPQLAKEKQTEDRLDKLESGLGDIKDMLAKVLNSNPARI